MWHLCSRYGWFGTCCGQVLLKEMECLVCMEYMVPPINLCANGHTICSKCRGRVTCCPTCRAEFSEIRYLTLENISRQLNYACPNRQRACRELFSVEHIAEHHTVCVYGKMKCPFKLNKKCSWNGFKVIWKNTQKQHMQHASLNHHQSFLLCLRIGLWTFYPASASYSCSTNGYDTANFTVLFSWLAQEVRLLNKNVNLNYVQLM